MQLTESSLSSVEFLVTFVSIQVCRSQTICWVAHLDIFWDFCTYMICNIRYIILSSKDNMYISIFLNVYTSPYKRVYNMQGVHLYIIYIYICMCKLVMHSPREVPSLPKQSTDESSTRRTRNPFSRLKALQLLGALVWLHPPLEAPAAMKPPLPKSLVDE